MPNKKTKQDCGNYVSHENLSLIRSLWRTWGNSRLWYRWHACVTTINATFVSDERDRDQNKHHDQDDALFVFRKFENPKQPFHCFT